MHEIRRIIFSKGELFSAFASYAKANPDFLPQGKLLHCAPIGRVGIESKVRAKVETIPNDPSKEIDVIFYGENVVEPLVHYCKENGIALPRAGRKTFIVVESETNLVVESNLDLDLTVDEAPRSSIVEIDRIREAIRR